jgi:DNA-binding transcriptional ArsR family regulator
MSGDRAGTDAGRRPYAVVRATAWTSTTDKNLEWSRSAMAEPVSAPVLAAIANPLRLALLVALERREGTPAELAAATGATEPAVEQALSVLHDVGLVANGARRGTLRTTGRGWAEVAARLARLDESSRPD